MTHFKGRYYWEAELRYHPKPGEQVPWDKKYTRTRPALPTDDDCDTLANRLSRGGYKRKWRNLAAKHVRQIHGAAWSYEFKHNGVRYYHGRFDTYDQAVTAHDECVRDNGLPESMLIRPDDDGQSATPE